MCMSISRLSDCTSAVILPKQGATCKKYFTKPSEQFAIKNLQHISFLKGRPRGHGLCVLRQRGKAFEELRPLLQSPRQDVPDDHVDGSEGAAEHEPPFAQMIDQDRSHDLFECLGVLGTFYKENSWYSFE